MTDAQHTPIVERLRDYAPHPGHKCPRCNSSAPHLHPAVAFEGEVQLCLDRYHLTATAQNNPAFIAAVKDGRVNTAINKARARSEGR